MALKVQLFSCLLIAFLHNPMTILILKFHIALFHFMNFHLLQNHVQHPLISSHFFIWVSILVVHS